MMRENPKDSTRSEAKPASGEKLVNLRRLSPWTFIYRERNGGGTTMKFRKKPIVIEAARLCWSEWSGALIPLLEGIISPTNPARSVNTFSDTCGEPGPEYIELTIPTLEGPMIARHGDWIIRGVAGEVYPCKPEIFAATYEPVP